MAILKPGADKAAEERAEYERRNAKGVGSPTISKYVPMNRKDPDAALDKETFEHVVRRCKRNTPILIKMMDGTTEKIASVEEVKHYQVVAGLKKHTHSSIVLTPKINLIRRKKGEKKDGE